MIGKAIKWGLVAVVVVFAFAILSEPVAGLVSSINPFKPASGQAFSSATVIRGIMPLGELTTYEAQFAKAGVAVHMRWGLGNICRVGASYAIQGTVRSAVDLAQIQDTDVTFDSASRTVSISLPPAKLSDCTLDPQSVVQYNAYGATAACPMDYDELRRVASYVAVHVFRDDAINGGLVERAETQAKLLLENFIESLVRNVTDLNDIRVNITFKEAEETDVAPSCVPAVPGGWWYNRGYWYKR
jgi:hypothetical protein